MMNGCEIIPTADSKIAEDTAIWNVSLTLGRGAYAITFLGGKGKPRAIKFQPFEENSAAREIEMCHAFNQVVGTRVFTKTFGWIALNDLPVMWFFAVRKDCSKFLRNMLRENRLFICTFMEYHPHSFTEVYLDMFHLKATWFILIHALVALRKQYKRGAHRDIHPGNILFTECAGVTRFHEYRFTTTQPLQYEPRLIDFQRAVLHSAKESPCTFENERTSHFDGGNGFYIPSDDMYRIAYYMKKKAKSQGMCGKEFKQFAEHIKTNVTQRKMYGYGHKDMEKLLREHPFFDDIRTMRHHQNKEISQQNKRLKV